MGRFRRGRPLPLLLLVVLSVVTSVGSASPSSPGSPPSGVALVSDAQPGTGGTTLQAALANPAVSTIIVQGAGLDVPAQLGPQLVRITRNITVRGERGTDTVWDQRYQARARVQLCGGCSWTFERITVAHDHKASGSDNDLFSAASLGARLVLRDAVVLRAACPSPDDALGVLALTPRSAAFGAAAQQRQQQHATANVTVQGVSYPGSLLAVDFSTDISPSLEGRTRLGGYALQMTNTSRACKALVATSCLDSNSEEKCTQQATEAALAADGQAGAAAAGRSSLPPPALAAAIAVPVAVVVAASAAGLAVWLCRRRRSGSQDGSDGGRKCNGGPGGGGVDEETGGGNDVGGPTAAGLRRPLSLMRGWSVRKAHTTPFLDSAEDDDQVEFGELIGSGSFGRVFKARWAGRECAVKVIEHTLEESAAVEREVALILSFKHPNIVSAYKFLTRVHNSEVPAHASSSSIANGHAAEAGGSSAGSRVGVIPEDRQPSDTAATRPPHCAPLQSFGPPAAASTTGTGSGSRCSANSSDGNDKHEGAGAAAGGNPQLQLVQRLPSLTGSTKVVHKVETWIVQEYCDCGTLAAVAAEWRHEPESDNKMLERLLLLQDMARGLQELHSRNVVHGDLNARNVLLSTCNSSSLGVVAKLADLGLSRSIRNTRSHHTTNTVGTLTHVAPELLKSGHMSTAADLYAFGVTMWELYTGTAAFQRLHVGQFFEAVVVRNLRPMIQRGMAADYVLLMESCWAATPGDRPSVERLLACLAHMIRERQARLSGAASPAAAVLASAAALTAASTGPPARGALSQPLPAPLLPELSQPVSPTEGVMHVHNQQQLQQEVAELLRACSPDGSRHGGDDSVRRSAHSYPPPVSGANTVAVPRLLALLRERGAQLPQHQLQQQQQQQQQHALLQALAPVGGRLHSSAPEEQHTHWSGSSGSGLLPHLTPINTTGRRTLAQQRAGGGSSSSGDMLRGALHQSDPLPACCGSLQLGAYGYPPQRSHGQKHVQGRPQSGGVQLSSAGVAGGSSHSGSSISVGPLLRAPGTSSLARHGSLGTSASHWYWTRGPAAAAGPGDDDTSSLADQDTAAAGAEATASSQGCPDVMAKVQLDLLYV